MPKATKYFIWSYRHSEWYGPDRSGYTLDTRKAGQYDAVEAADITLSGLPGGCIAVDAFFADRIPQMGPEVEKWLDEMRRI